MEKHPLVIISVETSQSFKSSYRFLTILTIIIRILNLFSYVNKVNKIRYLLGVPYGYKNSMKITNIHDLYEIGMKYYSYIEDYKNQ